MARMIDASKKSLDYFTREFSPYQYKQFRILEFPAYETFAQSFRTRFRSLKESASLRT
jgi:hypothetical protein